VISKIAIFSDAHGNPLGFEVCLRAARQLGAESFFFLGDAVGYMPGELAVMTLLAQNDVSPIRGNHEAMLLRSAPQPVEREAVYRLDAARSRLTAEDIGRIATWPLQRALDVGGRKVLLVHGSPTDPLQGYVYPDSDLSGFTPNYDAIFMGHTHRPFVRAVESTLFVNVGSVGLPRDDGSLAAFAVYDVTANRAEIIRVRLDMAKVFNAYGASLHPSVRECFARRAPDIVGRVV